MATKIINSKKFEDYSQIEKQLFECFRNAQLLGMPLLNDNGEISDTGYYDDDTIAYCENYAFAVVDNFPKDILFPPPPPTVSIPGTNSLVSKNI